MNAKKLTDGFGATKKLAKKDAATNGIEILRKYYYTIKVRIKNLEKLLNLP